jgi:leucyl aminopeptidase
MHVQPTNLPRLEWSGDGLAIGFFEDQVELTEDLAALDTKLGGSLQDLIAEAEFKGKEGSSASIRVGSNTPVKKLLILGLGKPETLKLDGLRRVAAAIARLGKKEKCKTVGVSLPLWNDDPAASAQAITEGMELALYQDNRFKSEPDDKTNFQIERVDLLGVGEQVAAIQSAQHVVSGVVLARQLVAAPANVVNPITMAKTAQAIATEHGLELEILESEDCERLGMGAFWGSPKPQIYRLNSFI